MPHHDGHAHDDEHPHEAHAHEAQGDEGHTHEGHEHGRTHEGHEHGEPHARGAGDATTGRYAVGASATGSNPGVTQRSAHLNEDAISGTTSGVPPKNAVEDGPRDQKPSKGSRFDPDL